MRTVRWLVAAGLLASATGCIEVNGLPNTSMGGYPSSGYNTGYYGQPSYGSGGGLLNSLFSQPSYYPQQQPNYYPQSSYYPTAAYQPAPQYIPVPVASPPQTAPAYGRPQWVKRDRNNNGVPDWKERDRNNNGVVDWKERDRNGNGVPDWQERRARRAG
jgi:hypothetical protein